MQNYLAKIHILKKELGLSDDEYRDFLFVRFGVRSAKDLSKKQLGVAISFMGGKTGDPTRYEKSPGRREGMATPAQLRMITALWHEVSFVQDAQKRSDALDRFLYKRFKCWLRSVPQNKVGPIRKTLLQMQKQGG